MNLRITACAYLRCKNDSYEDPFAQGEREPAVPRVYWCGKTLKSFGPDDALVGEAECQPGRNCHCSTIVTSKSAG